MNDNPKWPVVGRWYLLGDQRVRVIRTTFESGPLVITITDQGQNSQYPLSLWQKIATEEEPNG